MSKWAGKYVIGLTGNIGTGKSVVRRMLEHMGAFGIDADALSHRVIAKSAPGYQPVVEMFGRWVVGPDGEIDRGRLGRVVFSDKEALALLESIVHPLVQQAVDWMIRRSPKKVVVIEAIKLLESSLVKGCDSIWVVTTPQQTQLERLMLKRGMREAEARQRILNQSSQEQKAAAAQVVIKNGGTIEDTWRQVSAGWQKTVPLAYVEQTGPEKSRLPLAGFTIIRGRPRDSENIAALINRVKKNGQVTTNDIMAEFGDKAFLLLRAGDHLVGVAGWQVENLVARTADIVIDPAVPASNALPSLIKEMEQSSKDLQCEASLIFTTPELSMDAFWRGLGYERRMPQSLSVAVWQEAAKESIKPGLTLYFKQLREDRVLRPI